MSDVLNRLTHVTETSRGYPTVERGYIYDSLGNMIQEEADECLEYHYHGTTLYESRECCEKAEYNGTKRWDYTYDGRGNLVSVDKYQRTTQGMQMVNSEKYVYDETGKLVQGTNEEGEVSLYTYNGLGVRVGRELIVKDNTHGYTDFHKETPSVETGIDKPEVVKESYVVDYTRATLDTLVKEEVGGNTDRWLYGLQSLQVKVTSEGTDWWGQQTEQDVLTAYTHHDRLGSIVNLTDQYGRNLVRADYREYGEIAFFDSITVNGGYRRIAPQLVYTNHEWDDVLDLYYAKARFYDPDEKRFLSTDPVKGNVADPLSLVPYLYCVDNPLRWVDPLGLYTTTTMYWNGTKMSDEFAINDNGVTYISLSESIAHNFFDVSFPGTNVRQEFSLNPKYIEIGNKKIYYKQFGCKQYLPLREAVVAAGRENTLSWWSEHGVPTVVFNPIMLDAPIRVQREGDKVHIVIYASFSGDKHDEAYDNYAEAQSWHNYWTAQGKTYPPVVQSDYQDTHTYAELVAMGVKTYWSGPVAISSQNAKYDDFGGDQSITVDVQFYGDTASKNGIIQLGNPTPNQKYIPVIIDTSTNLNGAKEVSNTTFSDTIIFNSSTMHMYDHYVRYAGLLPGFKTLTNYEEYPVDRFKRTAAHEFGHAFGLGDAYTDGAVPVKTTEVKIYKFWPTDPNLDMMASNSKVSSNDLEMLLEAWKTNAKQTFSGPQKSPAIRSY